MKRKSGFTIIEVSLVLAIAGLIFLMMFIALPALQRSSRDTQRREDMMTLISAIKQYQSNNRGAVPTSSAAVTKYIGDGFGDPSGEEYKLNFVSCGKSVAGDNCTTSYTGASFPNNFEIAVVSGATCNGENAVQSNNPRKLAVLYKLEGGGVYCGNT